jgi:hypothetical protein
LGGVRPQYRRRRGLRSSLIDLCGPGAAVAVLPLVVAPPVGHGTSSLPRFRNEPELVILALLAG